MQRMLSASPVAGNVLQTGPVMPAVCDLDQSLTISLASLSWGVQVLPATWVSHMGLCVHFSSYSESYCGLAFA